MPATTDEEFVDALPTHELHVHLEGSMPPETLLALARRHGNPGLPRDLDGIRRKYEFRDFDHFIATYLTVVENLRDTEDFRLLTEAVLDRLAEQGVRYAEITWTPVIHTGGGLAVADVFAGLEAAREAAEARGGPVVRWVTDLPGHLGTEAAEETLDLVLRLGGGVPPDSVVGFGLGGPEVDRRPFARAFARARGAGLRSLPHAGEVSGPASVRAALDDLGAERIGHGMAIALSHRLVVQVLRWAARHGAAAVVPGVAPDLAPRPLLDLASGYVQRSIGAFPRQGDRRPWQVRQNDVLDLITTLRADLDATLVPVQPHPDRPSHGRGAA